VKGHASRRRVAADADPRDDARATARRLPPGISEWDVPTAITNNAISLHRSLRRTEW